MAQNVQNTVMFRKLSYYTVIMGVITRTLDHRVISPSPPGVMCDAVTNSEFEVCETVCRGDTVRPSGGGQPGAAGAPAGRWPPTAALQPQGRQAGGEAGRRLPALQRGPGRPQRAHRPQQEGERWAVSGSPVEASVRVAVRRICFLNSLAIVCSTNK